MKKLLTTLFCGLMLFSGIAIAQDYQCRLNNGCKARKSVEGKLVSVKFRKGDLVSTEDGWIVDTDDGWKKVRSKDVSQLRQKYNQHLWYSNFLPPLLHPADCWCWH